MAIDDLCAKRNTEDNIYAQIGYSDYKPKNFQYEDFMDREQFARRIKDANIVITHGGTGAIISAVKLGKKVIAVPRLPKYSEHVDEHQIQIINQFTDMNLIYPCYDTDRLEDAINMVQNTNFRKYNSNTSTIIESIDSYINKL